MQAAKTPSDALRALEFFPLRPGTDEWSYYVDDRLRYLGRAITSLGRMEGVLLRAAQRTPSPAPKILLSGHRGTGKTTELMRLQQSLGERFEVILLSHSERLNDADLDVWDLLLALAAEVVRRLEHHRGLARLERDPEAREALSVLRPELLRLNLEDLALDFNVLGLLSGRLRHDSSLREQLRRKARDQADKFAQLVTVPLTALEALVERPVLLLMDDLDKAGPGVRGREALFGEDLPLLLSIPAASVITVPVDIHHNPEFTLVHNHPHRCVLPHVKLWQGQARDLRFEPGWEVMRQFVARRAEPGLLAPGVLDEAIRLSGGSLELLRRLIYMALENADFLGRTVVIMDDVAVGAKELRANLVRLFGADNHVHALVRIHTEKKIGGPDDLRYLPMLVVMEYENEDPWFDTSPIFEPFLERQWPLVRARAGL